MYSYFEFDFPFLLYDFKCNFNINKLSKPYIIFQKSIFTLKENKNYIK